jgi:hypothetical protein
MHDQGSCDVAQEEGQMDFGVLNLLVGDDAQRPWAVDELAREIGERIDVEGALARLHGAGLVHRCGGFVFATRAAVRAERLLA